MVVQNTNRKHMISILFIGIGFFALLFAFNVFEGVSNAEKLGVTNGTIIDSGIDGGYRPGSGVSTYMPRIKYNYSVNNIYYTSSKITYIDYGSSDEKDVEAIVHKYPAYSTVTVYYDMKNPSNALLEPKNKSTMYLPLIFGSLFMLFGVISFFIDLK